MRFLQAAVLLALIGAGAPAVQAAAPEVNMGDAGGVALRGYDVMSYWNGGQPQKGDPGISAEYNGATWLFASEENRAEFLRDPAAHAPQYGGYCAFAASRNYIADVDPFAWRIWEGKLYLNYSPGVGRMWASDIKANISRADGYWPGVLDTE